MPRKQKDPEYPEWVICSYCGNEQTDMGRNVKCEECGEGPMPSPSSDRVPAKKGKP